MMRELRVPGRAHRARAAIGAVCAVGAVCGALLLMACTPGPMDPGQARKSLDRMVQRIHPGDAPVAASVEPQGAPERSVADTLPDIGRYPLVVEPRAGSVSAEIFSSTEKSGPGTDGALVEIARSFNAQGLTLRDGRAAQVAIRSIASGTGYEYIAYGKYLPDGFTPSNHLWIQMVRAAGVEADAVSESLVDNTAGIVMKESVYQGLAKKYGTVDVPVIINAVADGSLAMGYTNPFASSTGLNFLVTVLATFAKGEETRMLSPEVVSAFETFQKGVPFVSLTTMQMRDSVQKGGTLDAFILEYQTYVNTQALKSGYRFIAFGYPHDNPLYAIGNPPVEKREVLEAFARYVREPAAVAVARRYGFDQSIKAPLEALPSGQVLVQAQRLWKEKKDQGRPVAAVFLSDVSGSMDGARIKALKEALITGSSFIDPRNYIGLAEFSTDVTRILPIRQFSASEKARFVDAVRAMSAGGNTAMYDGILVALQMLLEERKTVPDAKLLLFVLTDGQTNRGLGYGDVSRVIEGLGIPVYTISYGEDVSELSRLSTLNEAATIRADPQDAAYQIGALLNAEM